MSFLGGGRAADRAVAWHADPDRAEVPLFSGEWWILFFPALTLLVLALAVNLLGDWLRDALKPEVEVMALLEIEKSDRRVPDPPPDLRGGRSRPT